MVSPVEMALIVSTLAEVIAKELSDEDIDILIIALNQLTLSLSLIEVERGAAGEGEIIIE